MDSGLVSDDCSLSYHLRFFEKERQHELEQKSQSRRKVRVRGNDLPDKVDHDFFRAYFK